MPLSSIIRIYRARLRSRSVVVQELLAITGLAVGVALLFASQVASTSLDHSVSQLTSQLVGNMQWQLESRGSEGFPRALLGAVRAIPGVEQALPVLSVAAEVKGPAGRESVTLLGTGPEFAHAGGPLLRRFSARQLAHQQALALPVALAQRIGAGSLTPIEVQVGAHVSETLLGATLQEADIGGLVDSPVAIAPVAYAEQLAGAKGQISRIFVRSAPGADARVHAALARIARQGAGGAQLNVEPASFDSTLFSQAAGPANQASELFSAISALVGFMFAFNALLITAKLRRELIGELRRHGATRLMTIQTLLFDALVLGLLGCAAGLALGQLLSLELFHPEPGYLSYAFPVGSARIITWQSLAISLGTGMLAACVGVLAPLRGSLARPLRDRGRAATAVNAARRRGAMLILAGTACLTLTTLILIFDPAAAILGSVSLVLALLALTPLIFDGLMAGFEAIQRPLASAATRIAAIELRGAATRTRSLAIAAIGAVAVFGAVAIEGARGNMQAGLDRVASGMNRTTAVWVSASGTANTLATTPFPESVRGRIAGVRGVRTVTSYRGGFLNVGDRRVWVIAPPAASPAPIPEGQIVQGDAARAEARLRRGGWAVISTSLAAALGLHVGESFTLPSPRPRDLRVAALSTNIGWPGGAIVMSSADFAKGWRSRDLTALNVDFKRGVTVSVGAAAVAHALGARSGLTVQTAAQREAAWRASSRQGLSRLAVIALLVLVAAVLATAGAMAAMLWQRRPQLAYLKRQGYRRSVLWRSLVYESALLLLAGCSIGAVFGLYGQVLLSHALASVTGFPVLVSLGPLVALWSVAVVSVAAAAIVAAPGYLAARVAPSVRPG